MESLFGDISLFLSGRRRRCRPGLLIKPAVYEGFWICRSTVPGLLIKPVVYEEFCRCEPTGYGLLIKPVVYEEFGVVPKQKKSAMCFLLQPITIGDFSFLLFLGLVGVWRFSNQLKKKTTFWRFPKIKKFLFVFPFPSGMEMKKLFWRLVFFSMVFFCFRRELMEGETLFPNALYKR